MASRELALCYFCGREVEMPFRCSYCNLTFCEEHRLPESHNCINLPDRSWSSYRRVAQVRTQVEEKGSLRRYVAVIGVVIVIALLLYYLLFD